MPVCTRRSLVVLAILCMTIPFAVAQSANHASPQPMKQGQLSSDQGDLSATKADLARMKVLVTQLQNNLGLTTSTTTPLYHQFELEIDMWQILISQMERRVERLEHNKGK